MRAIKPIGPTRVLFLSAEVAPLAKVGGLGDVGGALPKALEKLGVKVTLMLPFYGIIDRKKYGTKKVVSGLRIPLENRCEKADIYAAALPSSRIKVYLVKSKFFDGKNIYLGGRIAKGDHYTRCYDDIMRFTFFSKAVLEATKKLRLKYEIIHVNDWHTAIISDLIKTAYKNDEYFKKVKTVYTIHNLANQGIAKPKIIGYAKLDPDLPIIKRDLKDGAVNFMAQGILGSDVVNTVSPTYAKEILTHIQGAGLDNILAKRKKDLYGILNGIDTDFFDPQKDKYIYRNYTPKNLAEKSDNKIFLQKKLGLPADRNIALVGLVSRLVWQKGIELAAEATGFFAKKNKGCQFVFLGSGDKKYERQLLALAKKYHGNVRTILGFDIKLAQEIYAGADIFLMPSRFEPCGLGQMIAMRYGTIPLARATGGLKDTVNSKVGFSFKPYRANELIKTLEKAVQLYYDSPKKWKELQISGMNKDFSWNKSAKEYIRLYKKLTVDH